MPAVRKKKPVGVIKAVPAKPKAALPKAPTPQWVGKPSSGPGQFVNGGRGGGSSFGPALPGVGAVAANQPIATPAPPLPAPGGTTGGGTAPPSPDPRRVIDGPFADRIGDDSTQLELNDAVRTGFAKDDKFFGYQQNALAQDFGVNEVAPGTPNAVKDEASGRYFMVDVAGNPYSRSAMLKRTFDQRRQGDIHGQANMGHTFDGSAFRAGRETEFQAGKAGSDLGKSFIEAVMGINRQRDSTLTNALDRIIAGRGGLALRNATIEAGQALPPGVELVNGVPTAKTGSLPDKYAEQAVRANGPEAAGPPQVVSSAPQATSGKSQGTTSKPASTKPKSGYTHVQDHGPRKGLSYKVVKGKSGKKIRKYEDGSEAPD